MHCRHEIPISFFHKRSTQTFPSMFDYMNEGQMRASSVTIWKGRKESVILRILQGWRRLISIYAQLNIAIEKKQLTMLALIMGVCKALTVLTMKHYKVQLQVVNTNIVKILVKQKFTKKLCICETHKMFTPQHLWKTIILNP